MNAGREMDALVAEKVMGLEHREWVPYGAPEGWYPRTAPRLNARDDEGNAIDADGYSSELPFYSTSIADAWQVVEKLAERHVISVACIINRKWRCEIVQAHSMPQQPSAAFADTAPLAICKAALKACGVEVDSPK